MADFPGVVKASVEPQALPSVAAFGRGGGSGAGFAKRD